MTRRATIRCRNMRAAPRSHRGFTLIEMVMAITVAGIVAGIVAVFITRPVAGYLDLSRRAALVDAAESALRRMAREIRIALPNSVRVTNTGSGFALEVLPIADGAKYNSTIGGAVSRLSFNPSGDADWDNFGCFNTVAAGSYTNYRLVVNNLGTSGNNDAYTAAGSTAVITPAGITITVGTCPTPPAAVLQHINLSTAQAFPSVSPSNRLYLVQTPVTYLCDTASGTLTRYAGYSIQASQPTTAAALNALTGVTSAPVANRIGACSITTTAQDIRNRGLATLDLSISQDGETIRLIQQVQLDNSR